ncbi:hypothetical protein HRI_000228900 [Hibiscus trionum]|uniref:Uncharacterized protein n=1 Tax=Hibiscus trionum TaxID=183268 RepID=A0A9W7GVG3_HIBTR|nr:hypothetical protein HRI_000228900 [Hibiscus trionum]
MDRFFSNQSGDSNFLHDMVGEAASAVHKVAGDVADEVHSAGLVASHSGFIGPILSDAVSTAHGVATELQHAGTHVASEAILAAQSSPGVAGGVSSQVQDSGLLGTASGFIKQVSSDAISAAQNSPGVATEAQHSGLFGTASGLIKEVSSDVISAAHGVATEVQHAGKVGESFTSIDRLVPSVIKQVSSEAISAVQNVPGVATEVGNSGLLDTASGFLKQVSSDAISGSQGVATEVQHVGAVGESLAKIDNLVPSVIKQVSSEALLATQKVAGLAAGLASDVQHGGILSNATGLIENVSSQAISAAQGVAAEVQHVGAVGESLAKIDNLVPSVIKQVSAEALSATQKVAGVAAGLASDVQHGGILSNATGLIENVSSQAISAAQGVAAEVQHVGAVGESLAKIDNLVPSVIKQVSAEALSATQKVAGVAAGLASDVQHAGILSNATELIKDVSSQAISAAQGVVTELNHGGAVKEETKKLKYLAFVQAAIVRLVLLFTSIYTNLKQKSGLLKPVLGIIEIIVKTVLRPTFEKFFDALYERVKFLDDKVGELVTKIDSLLPSVVKQVLSEVILAARNALGLIVDVPTTEVRSTVVPSTDVVSQFQQSGLIPEELQMLAYLKYFKYFVLMQAAALHVFKFYFVVKRMSGPLKPVIDIIERAVISVYQKFFAEMVKRLVKCVLIKLFGVPAEIFDIIDKVGNLNKIAELSKLGNFSKFNALGKVEDVSRLGDLSNLGDMSNVGDLSKFGSLSKIDALIPSEKKMVSSGITSAAQNPPGVAGSSTELPGAVLNTASGFFKQAPSNAITGFQVMADVQHAGVVEAATKIDSFVSPLFKQVSSVATSVAQKASGVTSGGATEVQHTRLVSSPTGSVKQISSRSISAVQKAPRVAQGLATARVGSTGSGFITQLASRPIAVIQRSLEVQPPIEVPVLAKSIFDIVKPKVEKYAVSVWRKLNRIPLFPQVAWLVILIASFFTEKYNETVVTGVEKGYKVASFLPLVPTEKIAKVFSEGKSD